MNRYDDTVSNRVIFRKFKGLSAIMLAGALAAAATAAHAGPFDTLRSKVSTVRSSAPAPKPVRAVRDKTDELLQRAAETQSTVNAVIAETDAIKENLEPVTEAFETVRAMKERFNDMQFDPADLLEDPQVQDAVVMLEQQRQDMHDRLNDPHIESFRTDFLGTLEQLRGLVAEPMGLGAADRTPLQRLVENAPRGVIAVLKAASETGFEPLRNQVGPLTDGVEELRRLGVLEEFDSETQLCRAHEMGGEAIYFRALQTKKRIVGVTTALRVIAEGVPETPVQFGIHGYANLVEIDLGKKTRGYIKGMVAALDGLGARLDLVRETVTHYSAAGFCGA